jgi:hypothetical protein
MMVVKYWEKDSLAAVFSMVYLQQVHPQVQLSFGQLVPHSHTLQVQAALSQFNSSRLNAVGMLDCVFIVQFLMI